MRSIRAFCSTWTGGSSRQRWRGCAWRSSSWARRRTSLHSGCASASWDREGRSVVEPTALSPFAAWESFYVIIGSSAAALTGLQFVVIVLGAEARWVRGPELGAFGTPTIVHFCAVLLIAAILSVPWHAIGSAGVALGACGVAG